MPKHPNAIALETKRTNRNTAKALAELDVPVFPSTNKTPLPIVWQRRDKDITAAQRDAEVEGFHHRMSQKAKAANRKFEPFDPVHVGSTTDVDVVRRMWKEHPHSVTSISCGPAGLVVFDMDNKRGIDGPTIMREVFDTLGVDISNCPVTITQSGAQHVYFKNDGTVGCARLGSYNTDIKGIGGQVVAPNSIREDGKTYTPHRDHPDLLAALACDDIPVIPAALKILLADARKSAVTKSNDVDIEPTRKRLADIKVWPDFADVTDPVVGGYDFAELHDADPVFSQLWAIDEAEDRSKHRWQLALRLALAYPEMQVEELAVVMQENEACGAYVGNAKPEVDSGQYDNRDIARNYVRARTWTKFADSAAFGAVDDEDDGYLPEHLKQPEQEPEQPTPVPVKLDKNALYAPWAADIHATPRPAVEWLVDGMMTAKELAVPVGAPGAGKTADQLYLAACIASGADYHGRAVSQGAVLYVGSENREEDERRIEALIQHYDLDPNMPFRFFPKSCKLFNKVLGQVLDTPTKDEKLIIQLALDAENARGVKTKLIVIDNLRRVIAPGSTSSEEDVTMVMKSLERIRDATGATVSIIHHTVREGDRYAGSGAIESHVDSVWLYGKEMVETRKGAKEPKRNAPMRIAFEKLRLGDKTLSVPYSFAFEVVAKTTDGADIKTVVSSSPDAAMGAVDTDADDAANQPATVQDVTEAFAATDLEQDVEAEQLIEREKLIDLLLSRRVDTLKVAPHFGWTQATRLIDHSPYLKELLHTRKTNFARDLKRDLFYGQPEVTTPRGLLRVNQGAKRHGLLMKFEAADEHPTGPP